MRALLAVGMVVGLAGVGFAADDEKKAKKADGEKPGLRATKVAGEITAIEGNKVTVAMAAPTTKGDGTKKKTAGAVEFTVDDKTRIQVETNKDVETKNPKGKPLTAPERTDGKVTDLKIGAKVSGLATAEKVLLQVIQLRPAKEKDADKKPDGAK